MALGDTLTLPFFNDDHRRFAEALARWADARCRRCRTTTSMPPAGRAWRRWARRAFSRRWCRPNTADCIRSSTCARSASRARSLAFRDGLADFAFAMQGLGTGSISLSAPTN